MQMETRSFTSGEYRFGFNGKEKDDEIKGAGNAVDFGARIYDGRLGRWLSVDPMVRKYPGFTPYNFAINNPLCWIDKDGRDIIPTNWFSESGYMVVLNNIIENEMTFYSKYLKDYHTSQDNDLFLQYNNSPFEPTGPHGTFAKAQGRVALNHRDGVMRFSMANEHYFQNLQNSEWDFYKCKEITRAAVMIHEMVFHVSEGADKGADHAVSNEKVVDAVNMLIEYSDKSLPPEHHITHRDAIILTLNGLTNSPDFNSYLNQVNKEFGTNLSKKEIQSEFLNVAYEKPEIIYTSDMKILAYPEQYGDKLLEEEKLEKPIKVED